MDFMKVFDQTVREIKREVNLKVLKVPEIEQKVLDATDDEPWGPHGSALAEIATATKKITECQMIMNVLWTRLDETGKNWRLVYKALAVIEYLVGHGSERSVDDIIEHTFQISSLTNFEYVEPNGKDAGLNVRKKAENIVALLNDKNKIQEVRNKASANRDKYIGLSSTGMSYKSSATSFGSSNFSSSDQYDGRSSTRDTKESDSYREDYDDFRKFSRAAVNGGQETKKGSSQLGSKKLGDAKSPSSSTTYQNSNTLNNNDDEFSDFDPRGISNQPSSRPSNNVNLFGSDLIGDLIDEPRSVAANQPSAGSGSMVVDLFADATFVSASSNPETTAAFQPQTQAMDFFGDVPATSSVSSATIDLFSSDFTQPEPKISNNPAPAKTAATPDPFEAVPINDFAESDLFGEFSSGTNTSSAEAAKVPTTNFSLDSLNAVTDSTASIKEGNFQVKSGIWADSLTRGLIDLNISAPKKVSLIDVGVVGDLAANAEEKGPSTSSSTTRAMGAGSGLGRTSFMATSSAPQTRPDDDDFFSSLNGQQYQFGNFQR